jgi:hypothetical protein
MSTYCRALSPAKTVSGSEDSWLRLRLSSLWGGGRKQSGLHSFVIAAPLHVRQCVRARVSVSVLYKCVLASRNNVNRAHTSKVTDTSNARNMHLKNC